MTIRILPGKHQRRDMSQPNNSHSVDVSWKLSHIPRYPTDCRSCTCSPNHLLAVRNESIQMVRFLGVSMSPLTIDTFSKRVCNCELVTLLNPSFFQLLHWFHFRVLCYVFVNAADGDHIDTSRLRFVADGRGAYGGERNSQNCEPQHLSTSIIMINEQLTADPW